MTVGGRNLVILGIASVVIAFLTTGVSLALYHNSGDIYLDRSRPGYLPDEEEIEQDDNVKDEYVFDKTGTINDTVLEEYAENLQNEIEAIEAYKNPFSADALSDERLGI
ncbi:hypothetical protein J5868_00600 [Candidatus Saccharibacteria bacterium]|nr:hypothetical protein [Candidatus Saccharibacteria bacterium]